MTTKPYFDATHEQWVGEFEIRRLSGEVTRETEWFATETQAREFSNLTEAQKILMHNARDLARFTAKSIVATGASHGVLVSGHQYRTAQALERRELGTLRYQGPGIGWFTTQVSGAGIHERAQAMYDAHKTAAEFAQIFTRAELDELAKRCMLTPENDYTGEAYDDEVFDALAMID